MGIEGISDREVQEARNVLEGHVVRNPSRESAIECGLWCIASQATPFELACDFIYKLRGMDGGDGNSVSSIDKLLNKEKVVGAAISARWRFARMGRFDDFIDYFGRLEGDWVDDVVKADTEERKNVVSNVKWLGEKTYSFWHICLGGRNLIALDTHVMNQSKLLGIEVPKDYCTPVKRESIPYTPAEISGKFDKLHGSGEFLFSGDDMEEHRAALVPDRKKQKVRKSPRGTEYEKLERDLLGFFGNDERFVRNGIMDAALVDAVLWWRGVNSYRGRENLVFEEYAPEESFGFPYGSGSE